MFKYDRATRTSYIQFKSRHSCIQCSVKLIAPYQSLYHQHIMAICLSLSSRIPKHQTRRPESTTTTTTSTVQQYDGRSQSRESVSVTNNSPTTTLFQYYSWLLFAFCLVSLPVPFSLTLHKTRPSTRGKSRPPDVLRCRPHARPSLAHSVERCSPCCLLDGNKAIDLSGSTAHPADLQLWEPTLGLRSPQRRTEP